LNGSIFHGLKKPPDRSAPFTPKIEWIDTNWQFAKNNPESRRVLSNPAYG
jgi:hypothetical protein